MWFSVVSLSIRVLTTLNHIFNFFYHNVNVKENVERAREKKHSTRHTDASSVVLTLVENGKSTNQITRIVAVVVKSTLNDWPRFSDSEVTCFCL